MKNIVLVEEFDFCGSIQTKKDIEVRELFAGLHRRIVEVKLVNGRALKKHMVAEPITIFCLAGHGVFRVGVELENSQFMKPGTLISLEARIEHEVIAEPDIHFLITKFKGN